MNGRKKLTRSRDDTMVAGVAGGLGQYFGIDPTLVRVVFVLMMFAGWGLPLYVILWFIMPQGDVTGSRTYDTRTRNRTVDVPQWDDELHVAQPVRDEYRKYKRGQKAKRSVDDAEAAAERLTRRARSDDDDVPNVYSG